MLTLLQLVSELFTFLHVYFAFFKTTWNLEAERPDKGFLGFVGSRCN